VAMAASAGEVRHLFRALLREASRFSNYNVREYVKRRAIDAFHQYRDQSDPAVVDAAFKRGLQQLEIARRQSLVYSLYGPRVKSIMDLRSSK
jgi:glycerate kinase